MVLDQIRRCFLFESFHEPQLEEIFRIAREQTFLSKQNVVEAQQKNDSLWIVLEGEADEISAGRISQKVIKTGAVFGEHCLFQEDLSSITVTARGLLRTLRFKKSELADFFKRHPDCEEKTKINFAKHQAMYVSL